MAIRLFGAKRIAAKCDLTTDAVWKWPKIGGGHIPSKHQRAVLELAAEMGIAFTAADVVGLPPEIPSEGLSSLCPDGAGPEPVSSPVPGQRSILAGAAVVARGAPDPTRPGSETP
jgi:hypothetical protein